MKNKPLKLLALTLGLSVAGSAIPAVQAQTTITYANPALVAQSASSTSGSSTVTVTDGTAYNVGDVIRFTGTTAGTNPFGTAATNFYILSRSGNDIAVSTTPGGAAVLATNTIAGAATTAKGQGLLVDANWTGGSAPNSNSQIANFGNTLGSVPAYVINGATPGAGQTLYGLTYNGGGSSDLVLASGWSGSGTSLNALTFATNDATAPIVTTNGNTRILGFGSNTTNASKLAVAGTQGLIFNSTAATLGALVGTDVDATSAAPGKNIRLQNVDWTGLSGGITVQRGEVIVNNANAALPNQTLTVGNAQTTINQQIAGFTSSVATGVDALNGTSLGRVYGNFTLTVGNAGGSGDFAGAIGKNFIGTTTTTNLTKAGAGTQTISGIMVGAGAVVVNNGTLIMSGNNTFSGTSTVNGGTFQVDGANSGTGLVTVKSGGAVGGNGSLAGGLTIEAGGKFVFSLSNMLTVTGTVTLDGTFGIDDLIGISSSTADGTYTLIANGGDFSGIENFGMGNAFDLGAGKSAYFQNGSLQVVVVPEPSVFALLGLAAFGLGVRRRR